MVDLEDEDTVWYNLWLTLIKGRGDRYSKNDYLVVQQSEYICGSYTTISI